MTSFAHNGGQDATALAQTLLTLPPDEIDTAVRPISPEIADFLLDRQQARARKTASNRTLAEPAPHTATRAIQPCSTVEDAPAGFSDQAYVLWARTDDGSAFVVIVDPDPPEDA